MAERMIERLKTNLRVNEVMTHVKTHRSAYISGASCLFVGVVGTLAASRSEGTTEIGATQKASNLALVNWRPAQTQSLEQTTVVIPPLGDPGNVVRDLDTNIYYPSQGEASRATGVNRSLLSQQLNGKIDHVSGKRFERVGKAGEVAVTAPSR